MARFEEVMTNAALTAMINDFSVNDVWFEVKVKAFAIENKTALLDKPDLIRAMAVDLRHNGFDGDLTPAGMGASSFVFADTSNHVIKVSALSFQYPAPIERRVPLILNDPRIPQPLGLWVYPFRHFGHEDFYLEVMPRLHKDAIDSIKTATLKNSLGASGITGNDINMRNAMHYLGHAGRAVLVDREDLKVFPHTYGAGEWWPDVQVDDPALQKKVTNLQECYQGLTNREALYHIQVLQAFNPDRI